MASASLHSTRQPDRPSARARERELAFAHLSIYTRSAHNCILGILFWVLSIRALETPQRVVVMPGDVAEDAGRKVRRTRATQRVDAPEMSGNDSLLNGAYVSESVLNSHGWKMPGVPLYEAPTRKPPSQPCL